MCKICENENLYELERINICEHVLKNKFSVISNLPPNIKKIAFSSCYNIEVLPNLSEHIQELGCYNSDIKSLGNLSNNLKKIFLYHCSGLNNLVFPDSVKEITISYCQEITINRFPIDLQKLMFDYCHNIYILSVPKSLKEFVLSHCFHLTLIPELPDGLIKLDCISSPNLKIIPKLPDSLEELHISWCENLTKLTNLPIGLKKLYCSNCSRLFFNGEFPDGLTELFCSNSPNFLISDGTICKLPQSLKILSCSEIPDLSFLPNLERLSCYGSKRYAFHEREFKGNPKLNRISFSNCHNLIFVPEGLLPNVDIMVSMCDRLISDNKDISIYGSDQRNTDRISQQNEDYYCSLINDLRNNFNTESNKKWYNLCLGLKDPNSPLRFACDDILYEIKKYHDREFFVDFISEKLNMERILSERLIQFE